MQFGKHGSRKARRVFLTFPLDNNIRSMTDQEKQCRICLDGVEVERELGRLIRPCLCKGSISVSAGIPLCTTFLSLVVAVRPH